MAWLPWDGDAAINLMLQAMLALQLRLLHLLSWLHLTDLIDGQPAWPFALRLSGEVLLIDHNVARACATTLLCLLLALLLLPLLAVARRWQPRAGLAGAVLALLLLAPWPDRSLITTAATPTSFHQSPTRFAVESIVRGEQLYRQQCMGCHGADGRGNTPLGLALPVAPPNLSSGLLWRRFDGDLYWSLRHGKGSMPALAEGGTAADRWALLDYLKANAAGVAVRDTGSWPRPVALPDMALDCRDTRVQRLSQWQGQRIRLVVAGQDKLADEDPRFQSVLLGAPGDDRVGAITCTSPSQAALHAIAILTGSTATALAGSELLADRDGWLRARNSGGQWSEQDMLCRSALPLGGTPARSAAGSGLEQLIAAMESEPVRFIKGGFVH